MVSMLLVLMQRKISCLLLACFESLLVRLRKAPGLHLRLECQCDNCLKMENLKQIFLFQKYFLRELWTRTTY
jgi:hypothetical protein